ncbi:hypothetical protein JCM9279_007144 [Rhodotorula babjevae]
MATPPTGQQARKKVGPNHFTSGQVAPGSYVAAVRAVVDAAIKADPEAEADFLRTGRALCQDAIVERYENSTPSSRLHVQDRLDLWRRELEAHNILRHSFRWVFGTTEEERQQKNRRRAEQTGRRVDGDQVLEAHGGSGLHVAGSHQHFEPRRSVEDVAAAPQPLLETASAAHLGAGFSQARDVRDSFRAPSSSPEPKLEGGTYKTETFPMSETLRQHKRELARRREAASLVERFAANGIKPVNPPWQTYLEAVRHLVARAKERHPERADDLEHLNLGAKSRWALERYYAIADDAGRLDVLENLRILGELLDRASPLGKGMIHALTRLALLPPLLEQVLGSSSPSPHPPRRRRSPSPALFAHAPPGYVPASSLLFPPAGFAHHAHPSPQHVSPQEHVRDSRSQSPAQQHDPLFPDDGFDGLALVAAHNAAHDAALEKGEGR